MTIFLKFSLFVGLLFGLLVGSISSASAIEFEKIGPSWVFSTQNTFENTKDNLVFAIESQGLVISYVSHASGMLNRTAESVGVDQAVYGHAEIMLFCKADLSHALVAANPHNLTLCPYSIAVYTLSSDSETVYLSVREPFDAEQAVKPITDLLIGIIEETIDGF